MVQMGNTKLYNPNDRQNDCAHTLLHVSNMFVLPGGGCTMTDNLCVTEQITYTYQYCHAVYSCNTDTVPLGFILPATDAMR